MNNFLKGFLSLLQTSLILLLVYFSYQNFKTVKAEKNLTCDKLITEYEYLETYNSQKIADHKKIDQDHSYHQKTTEKEELEAFYYETMSKGLAETRKLKLDEKKQLIEKYCDYNDK